MTRTIANALLVATLAIAAPAYSNVDVFVKLKDINGEVTNYKPAVPGNKLKQNEAPKPETGNAKKKCRTSRSTPALTCKATS